MEIACHKLLFLRCARVPKVVSMERGSASPYAALSPARCLTVQRAYVKIKSVQLPAESMAQVCKSGTLLKYIC